MTNFGLADSFLRFIESQKDFKEAITSFQKYVNFPQYNRVHTLELRDNGGGVVYLLQSELSTSTRQYQEIINLASTVIEMSTFPCDFNDKRYN